MEAEPLEETAAGATPAVDGETGATAPPVADLTSMPFRVMHVASVLYDLGSPSPQVHLVEQDAPYRHLDIPIALADAQALHRALADVAAARPSTHELASQVIARLQADVIAVRIVRVEGGVFYAELDLMSARGREQFDCRPSDALVLALRQSVPAPILAAEAVLATFYE